MKFTKLMVAGAAMLALPAVAAAPAMSVDTFLRKAEALQKKGPMALFSGDIKLLTTQVRTDFDSIRAERLAAKAAGKPIFCPPEAGTKVTDKDVLGAMRAVPAPQRAATPTRAALRAWLVRRYPCS